ncbi:STAS domain-containing protein [Amycolatopsis sp. H6(2020)]|nr:STAS domain-containing protein [Amycolatopsis sp. H6(2020)]
MDADGLETEVIAADGRAVIRVNGELDLFTTPDFGVKIREALALGLPELVLDARGVTFISSGGMSALVGETSEFIRAGGRVVIRPSPIVARFIGLVGLTEWFVMDWDQEDS